MEIDWFLFVSAGIFKMSNSKSIFRNNVKIWHAMNVIVFDIQPIDWWTNSFDNEITFYASNRKTEWLPNRNWQSKRSECFGFDFGCHILINQITMSTQRVLQRFQCTNRHRFSIVKNSFVCIIPFSIQSNKQTNE